MTAIRYEGDMAEIVCEARLLTALRDRLCADGWAARIVRDAWGATVRVLVPPPAALAARDAISLVIAEMGG